MLQALFAYFIPSSLRDEQDPATRRQARLAVLIPLVGTGPLYAIPFYLVGFDEGAWVCLVLGGVIWTAPWLLRWTGSLPLVGHLITGLTLLHVVLLIAVTGGISSVMVPWLVNAVLVALLVVGRRAALWWFGVALTIIGGTYGLVHAGVPLPNRTPPGIEPTFVAVLQFNNTLVVFGLAFLLAQENERVVETLSEARREAEQAAARVEEQAEHLARLDAAKSEFFANLSHEFRTPLTIALGLLEEWTGEAAGPQENDAPSAERLPEAARRDLRQVLLNNRRLLRLVNQLLDLAQLESGTLALDPQRVDLAAFLRRLSEGFAGLAERKRIAFRRALPDRGPVVGVDPDHLETMVTNLLSNAFKYTPDGGRVTLALEAPSDGGATIRVVDTGPGIPENQREAIFDRFHRADETTTDPGTGIGLSLVQALAERHDGAVRLDSTVGDGSTFTLELPPGTQHLDAAPSDPDRLDTDAPTPNLSSVPGSPTPPPPASVESPDTDDPRPTVLVVDDNPDIRAYVRRHLTPDYRVVEATDGETGLQCARARTPDCIVADVMMPRMDGRALLRALRDDPGTDFIPVILLTARAASSDRQAGLDAGADDYLTKPFRSAELKTRIRNLIDQRMRLRERFQSGGAANGRADTRTETRAEAGGTDPPFLATVKDAVREHLGDEEFEVRDLARAVGVSRSTLYRRLDDVCDVSPAEVIWRVRVAEGRRLLEDGEGTVSEVAYGVGFKSVAHFTRRFRSHCDVAPSDVAAHTVS